MSKVLDLKLIELLYKQLDYVESQILAVLIVDLIKRNVCFVGIIWSLQVLGYDLPHLEGVRHDWVLIKHLLHSVDLVVQLFHGKPTTSFKAPSIFHIHASKVAEYLKVKIFW